MIRTSQPYQKVEISYVISFDSKYRKMITGLVESGYVEM